ncbi:MAG: aminopeptidase [Candidatus Heimdallarchaeota archaeon]
MTSTMYEKQAKLIVNYSVEVKKDDKVLIRGPAVAESLIREIYKEVVLAGGHPILLVDLEDIDTLFYKHAQEHHLDFASPFAKFLFETIDCDIGVWAEYNTRNLTNVPPEKLSRRSAAYREIAEIQFKRAGAGELKWNGSPFATTGIAQEASLSRLEFQELIEKTLFLDKADPIAEWKKVSEQQQRGVDFLNNAEELRIVGDDIDLQMSVTGRKWENCCGMKNLPDGEVFTAPVDDSATGHIRFKYPGIYQGKEIEDIRLKFEKGQVVEAKALKGEELLQTIIKTDSGAERIGEIGIGTNPGVTKLTRSMLFDEKMGGTIHLALGMAYPEVGGTNKSAIHWDILAQPSEMYADGEIFWKDGKFTI